jgi:MFS transporter, BCD family, chlorophyll transporter
MAQAVMSKETTASVPAETQQDGAHLGVGSNLKIGLFHLGSGMADVLTTGVWNRIMISDLGFAATPIGLLVSLRYFLAPIGIWAGRKSDEHAVLGYRRLFWIWLGRAMMALSVIALGFTTASIARGAEVTALIWVVISASMLLFSLGNAISGSTFLALIHDRASDSQRTRAVGVVWTFLLLGFTIGGIFFGILLPSEEGAGAGGYSPDTLLTLFLAAAGALSFLWFISLLGEEKRSHAAAKSHQAQREQTSSGIMADLKLAFSRRETRFFFFFLALSMAFAFSQDLILEPFGGDVFSMSANVTTRFAAYWGSTAIIATIVFIVLSRRFKSLTNRTMSIWGVAALLVAFGMLAFSSFAGVRQLVAPAIVVLGIGLGIWNVGALGLMMDMSPFGRAGTFLGFWTLVVTLARGLGVSSGGIMRDVFYGLSGSFSTAYGIAFAIGAVGLGVSLWALWRMRRETTPDAQQPAPAETVFSGSMD